MMPVAIRFEGNYLNVKVTERDPNTLAVTNQFCEVIDLKRFL
jgi:hypothetical protein